MWHTCATGRPARLSVTISVCFADPSASRWCAATASNASRVASNPPLQRSLGRTRPGGGASRWVDPTDARDGSGAVCGVDPTPTWPRHPHTERPRALTTRHTPHARASAQPQRAEGRSLATAADSAAHGGARMINEQRQGRAPPPAAPFSIVATAAVHGKKRTKEYSPQRRPATAPLSPSGFIAASKEIHGGRQE